MTVFFTSDTHFGHKRINELAERPFSSLEQGDEMLIHNWNSVVMPGDVVYHLGDFTFKNPENYAHRLNGEIHLIFGNHDAQSCARKCSKFTWTGDYKEIEVDDTKIVLFHYAMRVWHKAGKGALHFYGHSHGNLMGDSQSCDVGVDAWNYFPVTLAQIRGRLKISPKRGPEPDHH